MKARAKQKTSWWQRFVSAYGNDGHVDYIFLSLVIILFTAGIIMMFSAGYASAIAEKGKATSYLLDQLPKSVGGLIVMLILMKVDYKILNSPLAIVAYFGTIVLLIATLAVNTGGTDQDVGRWISIFGFKFQPSEMAKFTLIIVLSYCMCVLQKPLRAPFGSMAKLTFQNDRTNRFEQFFFKKCRTQFSSLVFLALVIGSYCLLVLLEKHVSATIVVFMIGFTMLVLSGADKRIFYACIALGVIAVVIVLTNPEVLEILPGFARSRVEIWLYKDDVDARRQTMNSLYAIASGGLFGVGFGQSAQKQLYLAESHNDFIFPILVEELGFLGGFLTILVFAFLIYRGYRIAMRCNDLFGSLIVMGIMNQIALQVIINLAVVTDLIPNTGMPLPFFSFGGTAILVLMAEMGVVLSISKSSTLEKN